MSYTYDSFDVLVFAVDPLYSENVITKVESLESSLLAKKNYHCTTGPVQALAEQFSVEPNNEKKYIIIF